MALTNKTEINNVKSHSFRPFATENDWSRGNTYTVLNNTLFKLWDQYAVMPSRDPVSNDILSKRMYEETFGIRLSPPLLPIDNVLINPADNGFYNNQYESTINRLISLKIPEITNMGLIELLELPSYILKIIINTVIEVGRKDVAALDNLGNLLKKKQ